MLGDKTSRASSCANVKTGATHKMPRAALFIAIGHEPNTEFLQGQMEIDEKGYIVTHGPTRPRRTIPGVFVAGDVVDVRYRQAVTAADQAARPRSMWNAGCTSSTERRA